MPTDAMAGFSDWVHWDQQSLLDERRGPGVYLLGRFEDSPPSVVDPRDQRIILIAETHDQTLERRWNQFHYSAFKGGSGHAGGVTFHRLFNNGSDPATPAWLYLSASGTPSGVGDAKALVQAKKEALLADYEERYGLLPVCNARASRQLATETPAPASAPTANPAPVAIEQPTLEFTAWRRWTERDAETGSQHAGVYALARFESDPPLSVDVLDKRVVYIGETCDNSISGRLYQFNRSAFRGKSGHSGGWSYSTRCGASESSLWVSMLPVSNLHEPHRSAFIRHTERSLLWQYVSRWGRRPLCNSK